MGAAERLEGGVLLHVPQQLWLLRCRVVAHRALELLPVRCVKELMAFQCPFGFEFLATHVTEVGLLGAVAIHMGLEVALATSCIVTQRALEGLHTMAANSSIPASTRQASLSPDTSQWRWEEQGFRTMPRGPQPRFHSLLAVRRAVFLDGKTIPGSLTKHWTRFRSPQCSVHAGEQAKGLQPRHWAQSR